MNKELDERINEFFLNNNVTEVPKTYKEKLIVLRNLANGFESDVVEMDEHCNKLYAPDDMDVNVYLINLSKVENKYEEARDLIIDVKTEIVMENIDNFTQKIKKIFKK